MKNLSVFFCLVFFNLYISQTTRFIYELKYKEDSTSTNFEKENVILDIDKDNVQYYEAQALEIDSINKSNPHGFSNYTYPIPKLKRKLSSETNQNYYFVNDNYWVFESQDPIVWKLETETKQKGEWKLQKATTKFGGRHWTAWFTAAILYSEGPYKFKGLPGLIVELYDDNNNYFFELAKIEKPKNPNLTIVETLFKKKPIVISYKKYIELQTNYYSDPYSIFREMKAGTWSIGKTDGSQINTIEGLNIAKKEEQERIRKNNNPIELDKAIIYPVR